jgi:hypothetical protein
MERESATDDAVRAGVNAKSLACQRAERKAVSRGKALKGDSVRRRSMDRPRVDNGGLIAIGTARERFEG